MIARLEESPLRKKQSDNRSWTKFYDKNIRLRLRKSDNITNYVVMPKKNTKNFKESRIGKRIEGGCKIASSEVIVKQFRSIRVNIKNAKRWFMLKKRLALVTDDELVAYLLDLAEPIIRRDGKCSRGGDWKADQDKENDLELLKMDEKDSPNVEEPLRRSPRKQCIVSVVTSETVVSPAESAEDAKAQQSKLPSSVDAENDASHAEKRRSRMKHHHKTKEKHHRDKRARRKHSRNNEVDDKSSLAHSDERSVLSEGIPNDVSPSVPKIIVERLSLADKKPLIVYSPNEDKKSCILAENLNKSKRSGLKIDNDMIIIDRTIETEIEREKVANLRRPSNAEESSTGASNDGKFRILNVTNEDECESDANEESYERTENIDVVDEEIDACVPSRKKTVEEKRSKKKRKHSKHDSSLDANETFLPTEETVASNTNESVHKRRKKKHKRGSGSSADHSRAKKFHDVRKAPQDGMIENAKTIVDETIDQTTTDDTIDDSFLKETNVKASTDPSDAAVGENSEPHRLAIKIKLCQDCNNRHVKDTCPLISTDNHVKDRLGYNDWLTKHKGNAEVLKAIASEDPISEGYIVANDDNDESDEETANAEQTKAKTKNESEDKQLRVNDDRPLYSRESLPDCFQLKLTNPEHGIGIYASISLPIYTKFGPLVGCPIKEKDIPDDFSMRHLWEIDNDGKISYTSTTNPLKSNWMRYMRPADAKEDKNMTVVTRNGELYLVSTRDIVKGTELTYWADSQSSAWTRKNKVDKTNCGGCNLNFTHSIYYRLHCCIFHDTRYSLTIRKYHCKVCGAAVLGKDNIMKHAADLHGGRGAYQCQYCRKFFLRLNYLEMHRTYGCSQNPQRSRPLCDFCGRKFCQPQKLKVHIKRMHSDMSEVLREFQCKMCLKLLGSRAALQRHMKEVHHKDVVGAATCDRCGKMFQNKSNLKIHMLTHSGVKPFKCKEVDCKAAFTTKQCLQFHYKKVHGLSEDMMPKIERSVAYTFDAYSGGLVEGIERRKTSKSDGRSSQQENSNSVTSLEDCSSEHSSKNDATMNAFQPTINEFDNGVDIDAPRYNLDRYILERNAQNEDVRGKDAEDHHQDDLACQEMEDEEKSVREKRESQDYDNEERDVRENDLDDFEKFEDEPREGQSQGCEMRQSPTRPHSHREVKICGNESSRDNDRTDVDFYGTRLQSKGSKKWMGQFGDMNEPEIVAQHHNEASARSDVYEFNEMSVKKSEDRNNALMSGNNLSLNIYRRPESTNASLLVEAALDAAERDIGAVTSPIIDDNDREANIYGISGQMQTRHTDGHMDPYIQQEEELLSPSSMNQDNRKTPTSHVHMDYHLHRPVDYMNSPRPHVMEQYLPQDDLSRVNSPGPYSIHMQQDDLSSPSATPSQNRYQEIHHHHHHQQQQHHQQQPQEPQHHHHHHHHHPNHHQVPNDNLSSDEGDSVAQNLSISVKDKSLQLELQTPYKYEQLDVEFSRERTTFEPIVLSNGELQGLDMSARGYHHPLGSQIVNTRYHHHHLYEITERQSVDLSRATGYSISPPSPPPPPPPPPPQPQSSSTTISPSAQPPPYPHGEVLRIVSLDLTPGHSVDLSLSRTHHLHSNGNRIIAGSPQPSGSSSASHVVPDNAEGRILTSPPPLITGYNSTYPVSPAAYHPPRAGYHHYSGYY